MRTAPCFLALLALGLSSPAAAADAPSDVAPTVAATRPELKQQLEGSKHATPRLPLPPPTAEEVAQAQARTRPGAPGLGGLINNGRMRKLYLPPEVVGGGFSREPDPALTLSPNFKTMLFWIVSRANNCAYCQGHQEVKLAAGGVTEADIAALDGDWSEFPPSRRAAFAFTKKLTFEPHRLTDADLDALRPYYNDRQILEILMAVAGFNAMNRWTGGLAIPQEGHRDFLTPTPPKYENLRSLVAPLNTDSSAPSCARPSDRGPLESRAEVETALAACRQRSPRLPLASVEQARALLPEGEGPEPPEWVRLLANFPKAGKIWVDATRAAETRGRLDRTLKAEIAWVAARQDRAWYALGHARRRLKALGVADDALFALDRPDDHPPAERAVLALARKLTADPALVADADIAALRRHYSDHEVAEVVYHVTHAAFFDRLTEASGLRLEE